jgi:L-fuconolactonase
MKVSAQPVRMDSHQHFWQYDPAQYRWISETMRVLRRDFLPDTLGPLLSQNGFHGAVAVQARQSVQETEWLLALAEQFDFIKGVVGWVDLQSRQAVEQIQRLAGHAKLKGLRHVVHDEPDDHFMLRPAFQRGLALLQEFNLTFDLLLFPHHLPVAVQLVERFPQQRFVVDHLAKPLIRDHILSPWDKDLAALAGHENVYGKLSGMVTEAAWHDWKVADFTPYLDTVLQAFGPDRVMIGSDWPVCTVAGSYQSVMQIVIEYIKRFSKEEQDNILGMNCCRFYQLDNILAE